MPKRRTEDSATAPQPDHHAQMQRDFRWLVPAQFNIAEVCCARWARAPDASERIAIRIHSTSDEGTFHSYFELQKAADSLSHALAASGIGRGDRVAIVLPQRFETAAAYIAVWQLGAIALPLSVLFGPEALEHRLIDSGARAAIADDNAIDSLNAVRAHCTALAWIIGIDGAAARADLDWQRVLADHEGAFEPVATQADDGAILIYTSGTTGPPKGALIPHRALIGNLSGFVCSQNWFGFDPVTGEARSHAPVFWSPADWAWTGGLMDALLPTLYFGREIVACRERFSPELAFGLMQRHRVTHTFLFPTALKAMMKAYPRPREHFELRLEAIMSAGEAVGDAVFDWCERELGITVNEMFGQTEINYIVGNCAMFQSTPVTGRKGAQELKSAAPSDIVAKKAAAASRFPMNGRVGTNVGWPARAGSMGKPYPGHRVMLLDDDSECATGVAGDVALCRTDMHGDPDPIFFLGYWNNDAATRAKFTTDRDGNEWCRTGDLATRDADGYLWYRGRADDVFKSAGYRIGPSEIENCLVKHPAVANAAVVPKPDRERGALVKAYVVLASDFVAARQGPMSAGAVFDEKQLIAELQEHVKSRLAPYEYPKEIEFIDALPMTTTGKVQRRMLRLQEERRAEERKEER